MNIWKSKNKNKICNFNKKKVTFKIIYKSNKPKSKPKNILISNNLQLINNNKNNSHNQKT